MGTVLLYGLRDKNHDTGHTPRYHTLLVDDEEGIGPVMAVNGVDSIGPDGCLVDAD